MLHQGTSVNAISGLENIKPVGQLNKREKDLVNGKIVPQRSLRQKTTIFKAGTHCYKTSTELLTFRKIEFGSAPAQLMNILFLHRSPVVHLVEHRAVTREVVSSTPARPTLRVLK